MKAKINLIGHNFYKLTVIGKTEKYWGHFRWICLCECGNKVEMTTWCINNTTRKSCGCWRKPITPILSTQDRFYSYINKTEGCWLWQGYKTKLLYGRFHSKGKNYFSHRYLWEIHKGPIPKGMYVCHKCDNPSCVNPDHLFLGTQQENMNDMINKKRQYHPRGEDQSNSILTEEKVLEIRKLYKNPYNCVELSKIYKVSKQTILDILHRKAWKHI